MATYEKAATFTIRPLESSSQGAASPDSGMPLIEIISIENIVSIDITEISGP